MIELVNQALPVFTSDDLQERVEAAAAMEPLEGRWPSRRFVYKAGPPGWLTTSEDTAIGRWIGLHIDNWDRLPYSRRQDSRRRLCINYGPGTRHLLVGDRDIVTPPLPEGSGFSLPSVEVGDGQALPVSNAETISGKRFPRRVNPAVPSLDRMEICAVLGCAQERHHPHTDDIRRYVAEGDSLRCLRIRLEPGQGYIAPTEILPHDGSTSGAVEWSLAAFWLG